MKNKLNYATATKYYFMQYKAFRETVHIIYWYSILREAVHKRKYMIDYCY